MGMIYSAQATPAINTLIYTSGDSLGGLLTLSNICEKSRGIMTVIGLVLSDLGSQSLAVDVIFFSSNPSGTIFTNNSPLDIADADMDKIIGVVNIPTTAYFAFVDNSVAVVRDVNLTIKKSVAWDTRNVYCHLVARGTPTYTSTSDLTLTVLAVRE